MTAHDHGNEEGRLDDAMRRADDLLLRSLKQEQSNRRRKKIAVVLGVAAAACLFATLAWSLRARSESSNPNVVAAVTSPTTQPIASRDQSLSGQLLALTDDWRQALALGNQLAAADPDVAVKTLSDNWSRIASFEARQQLLKAFVFANHPRVLDVLDLGMNDSSPRVREWASNYLCAYAFAEFSEDSSTYPQWRKQTQGKPLNAVAADAARAWIERLKQSSGDDLKRQARFITGAARGLETNPSAAQAARDAGALDLAAGWMKSHADDAETVRAAEAIVAGVRPDEQYLRATVLPLLDSDRAEVRSAAARLLGRKGNGWAVDPLLAALRASAHDKNGNAWDYAAALGEIGEARAIPPMIETIADDNTYNTVYGVGYFGLSKLTGVRYDESHDGAWWQTWWQREQKRFSTAGSATTQPVGANATSPRVIYAATDGAPPVQDLRAAGNDQMRFFLIGPAAKEEPKDGYHLLLVLPGGDGGADFQPFVTNILVNALPENYLIAQLVAPQWSTNENRIVWPTQKSRDPKMKFTTEAFIDAVVAETSKQKKIDAAYVYALGWSSGGPAVYFAAIRPKTPLVGAFVAMSVFKPAELPPAQNLKGRRFYILHSPQDFIAMRFPQSARDTLKKAGAETTLQTYEGGHGWQGDMFGMIRAGIDWLESTK
jgi:predicted esterase